jgi:hypothetical protein
MMDGHYASLTVKYAAFLVVFFDTAAWPSGLLHLFQQCPSLVDIGKILSGSQ